MIDIVKNPELYSFDDMNSIFKSFEYSKSLPDGERADPVTFHFYWRVPRDFSRKQVLPLKATIVTQRTRPTKIVLWSNVELRENPYLKPLEPFVETRVWSLEDEIKGTPLEDGGVLKRQNDDDLCWLGGDLFRLLTLYKYGGVYLDMDTVPLRDFSPLLDYEFMYQWGSSGTTPNEPDLMINGAVMRLRAKSELATELLRELAVTPGVPNSNSWGRDLYGKVRRRTADWLILPCAWFDTEWALPKNMRPRGPFKNNILRSRKKLYLDGPFAWHWHNQWDARIGRFSKFALLERIMDERFAQMTK